MQINNDVRIPNSNGYPIVSPFWRGIAALIVTDLFPTL